VLVQVYRTVANGTVYYQISNFNLAGSLYNQTTADTLTWVDTQAEHPRSRESAALHDRRSALQRSQPSGRSHDRPPHRLSWWTPTNPTQIWYSRAMVAPGSGEFSGFQVLQRGSKGGADHRARLS